MRDELLFLNTSRNAFEHTHWMNNFNWNKTARRSLSPLLNDPKSSSTRFRLIRCENIIKKRSLCLLLLRNVVGTHTGTRTNETKRQLKARQKQETARANAVKSQIRNAAFKTDRYAVAVGDYSKDR